MPLNVTIKTSKQEILMDGFDFPGETHKVFLVSDRTIALSRLKIVSRTFFCITDFLVFEKNELAL